MDDLLEPTYEQGSSCDDLVLISHGLVHAILPRGEGVVTTDAGSILLPDVLPGEVVDFQRIGVRRGAVRGQVVAVKQSSPDRIVPLCSVADQCGGCALQHVSPSAQARIKSAWVHDAFVSVLDQSCDWVPLSGAQEDALDTDFQGQRRRVRWHVGHDALGYYLGFHARSSHQVVRTSLCMLLTPALQQLQCTLAQCGWISSCSSVQALQLFDGIHLVIEGDFSADFSPDDDLDGTGALPIQCWVRHADGVRACRKPALALHERIEVTQQALQLRVGPDDFLQGQYDTNQLMVAQVVAWCAGAKRIVDLFSGNGNLSLPLTQALSQCSVIGADACESGVRMANFNAKILACDAHYQVMDLFHPKQDLRAFVGADVLILDPPRKGAKSICAQMGMLMPQRIVMINCDLAAGARDAKTLQQEGYRCIALRALDMFHYAGHVEVMSLWQR
ncbi:MAG: class I SAM-dependent RNA methyltransferase [Zetaproteobacteria bacterium]|nr:class I SAM-dependent RNA methyltransferase [Zetaproteobacteria bacterium]